MLELFPEGFEEADVRGAYEAAAYTDEAGVRRARAFFSDVEVTAVEQGWEHRWRDFHRPARVGPLWLGAPWLEPDDEAVPVTIDPGRAFGTGAHATTRLCLELLLEVPRGRLLDAGCGSGVVAIAAAKIGFRPVVAVDADAAAVESAERNAAANGVALDVRCADVLTDELPHADVCVANISLATVDALARRIRAGTLVTSGYLARDEFHPPGYQRRERRTLDRWAADLFARE